MSRYEARPHQDVFVNSVLQMLKEKDKVLGQAACGFGKTLCMTFFIERSALETLILVNSIDLLNQTVETFERQGLEISSFTSKDKKFPEKGTVVCMTETLKKRVVKKTEIINRFDLFIIDECHVLIYEVLLKYFENKKLIGYCFIATPFMALGYFFDPILVLISCAIAVVVIGLIYIGTHLLTGYWGE